MDGFDYFNWLVLPLLIFLSRLTDVSLATMRHIFVSKGFKKIVPFLGFVEVLIWLVAMRQVFNNLNNWACFFAWAGGFATGTYCGMLLEERIALGTQMIRIITDEDCKSLVEAFRLRQHGLTLLDGQGSQGPVKIIFTVVKRINKKEVITLIEKHLPNAFYSVEDVRSANQGVFSSEQKLNFIRRLFPEIGK